ncbi:MAG: hypothetical protein Kow00109_22940 [Acidobacteriota bacterium]
MDRRPGAVAKLNTAMPRLKIHARREKKEWRPILEQGLVLFAFAALPFIFSIEGYDQFRLPKAWAWQAVTALLLLAGASSGRLGSKFGWRSWEGLLVAGSGYVLLHALVFGPVATALQGWFYLAAAVLFYLLIRHRMTPDVQERAWLLFSAASGVNAVLCIAQFHGWIPVLLNTSGEVLEGRLNPAGLIGEVNSGGMVFALASLIGAHLAVFRRGAWRILAAACTVANLAGLAYTRTLSALGGFAAALVVLVVLFHWWVLRRRLPRRVLAGFWAAVFVLGLGAGLLGWQAGLVDRVMVVVRQAQRGDWTVATAGRAPVFSLTWAMIREAPVLGRGLNSFGRDFFYFRTDTEIGRSTKLLPQPGAFREAHNDYLQVWDELGIVGLALLLGLLIVPAVSTVRRLKQVDALPEFSRYGVLLAGWILCLVVAAAFFPLRLALTAFVWLGLAASLRAADPVSGAAAWGLDSPRRAFRVPVRVGLVILGSLWLAGLGMLWRANVEMGRAAVILQAAASGERGPRASRLLAGEAVLRLGRIAAYGPFLRDFASLYGSALLTAGRHEEAVRVLQEAVETAPSPELWTNLGVAYLALERHAEAERCFQKALAYEPGYDKAREALQYLRERQGA